MSILGYRKWVWLKGAHGVIPKDLGREIHRSPGYKHAEKLSRSVFIKVHYGRGDFLVDYGVYILAIAIPIPIPTANPYPYMEYI